MTGEAGGKRGLCSSSSSSKGERGTLAELLNGLQSLVQHTVTHLQQALDWILLLHLMMVL